MGYQTWIGAVVNDHGRPIIPSLGHFPQAHLPGVERLLDRALGFYFTDGVPDLQRRVHE